MEVPFLHATVKHIYGCIIHNVEHKVPTCIYVLYFSFNAVLILLNLLQRITTR